MKRAILHRVLGTKVFVQFLYFRENGRLPNFKSPRLIGEKISWLKLYDYSPHYNKYADKLLLKSELKALGFEALVIPTAMIIENWDNISWSDLVYPLIIKTSSGSGDYKLIKEQPSRQRQIELRDHFTKAARVDLFLRKGEPVYRNQDNRVFIEGVFNDDLEPIDIKVHVGKEGVFLYYITSDRFGDCFRGIYDTDLEYLKASWDYNKKLNGDVYSFKPRGDLNSLVGNVKEISEAVFEKIGSRYLRIDFLYSKGALAIGEITFYHMSGIAEISPLDLNMKIAKNIVI